MKLNCDMGESFGSWTMGKDADVMPYIDMANIACGFHASDPDHMAKTIQLAVEDNVEIGAHPGYDDKSGFGRRSIPHSAEAITRLVAYQIGALDALCQLYGGVVSYVKPHGALYNDMMAQPWIFEAILSAVADLNPYRSTALKLMILARRDNQQYIKLAEQRNVELLFEGFADRAYDSKGLLVPRSQAGSVYHDSQRIRQQVAELANGKITTIDGKTLVLDVDTVCVHGDNDESIAVVRQLAEDLANVQG
ncbi:5-oxoprolinase subunit PxpA [Photobacterium rosenbergii]|uniref:5-oxoprolinase subunit PxpA n=1 Tax=Photobacterium rosenbergii TaxID=294936 RepID=A0ABU3ZEI4_9GAMM|nr:5-oxoprolinase subunit PxpA [Photobacterium rosenbergii]MDV5168339.1 5-oxoprolinase subunit PxpA [Photobacterium rosenbergii]